MSTKQVSKVDTLKNILNADSVQEQFKNALKDSSDLFVASVIDLYSGDNYLQNCDPKLVVMEALKAAVLRLPINKALGFAYVVPYKKSGVLVPQFQIGYKGLIQLAMRTSEYRIINADKVFEGELRRKNKLTGEFDFDGTATSDRVIGYFAHIEMNNGFGKTLYMTTEGMRKHAEKYSKSYNEPNGPWTKEFDAMAMKTVIRNLLSHYGYLSVEMQTAIKHDLQDEDVSDKVNSEIQRNGNRTDMAFEDAEVVTDFGNNDEAGF